LIENCRELSQRFGELPSVATLIVLAYGGYAFIFGPSEEIHDLHPSLQVSRARPIIPALDFLGPNVQSRTRRDDIGGERNYV